jgi:predicted O-methyltransferase YrrM
MQEPYSEVTDEYALWSCHDEDSTETEVIELLGSLVRATKPRISVEVGSYIGLTSFEIGTALERNGRGELHCFESAPEPAREAEERTAGLPVTVHCMADVEYDPAELPGLVDFLFLDGDLDNRGASLLHWRPWLSPNHIVAVHDWLKHWDVRQSLESVAFSERIDIVTPRGLALMKVADSASSTG